MGDADYLRLRGDREHSAGYRAREAYTILGKDEFSERFEIAEPGKDFTLYSENRLHRVREK